MAYRLPRILQVEARYVRPAGPARFGEVICRFDPLDQNLASALDEPSALVFGAPPEGHPLRAYVNDVHDALAADPHILARITWIGGRHHPVDTNRHAMQVAARCCLIGALHLVGIVEVPMPPSAKVALFDGDRRKLW